MASITLTPLDPNTDTEPLATFLATNAFPFHGRSSASVDEARATVDDGRFWSDDSVGFWIDADREPVGIVVIDDVADITDGGNPVFDLRLAEPHRGRGFAVPVLAELTRLVFERWPAVERFEGHTREDNLAMRATFRRAGWVKEAFHRDAWPVDGGLRKASVTYAVLRRDWEAGTATPVVWDDL